jgi:hypothetical protein
MPLWRLQRIGTEQLNFLYEKKGDGGVIQLLPGIAYCFRKFHALISDLVQGAWVRYVRQQNLALIGETADLHEFLFGSERNSLALVRPVLLDVQQGRCFYCIRSRPYQNATSSLRSSPDRSKIFRATRSKSISPMA